MHSNDQHRKQDGFTLIELLVVIAIISILAAIGINRLSSSTALAQKNACTYNMATCERLYQTYIVQGNAAQPNNTTGCSFLVTAGLLTAEPICKSGGTYTWTIDTSGTAVLTCSVHGEDTTTTTTTTSILDNLITLKGSWSITDDTLVPTYAGENRAIIDGTDGSNYTITVTSQLSSGKGYGIYYYATDSADISGYCFQYDPGLGNKFAVREVVNGVESAPIALVSMSVMGSDFDINASHVITISVENNVQTISVDGVQVLQFTDSTFTSGYVGMRSWSNSQVTYSDISVTSN